MLRARCTAPDPAGRILESSHASVYVLKQGAAITGLLISSAAAEQDD